MQQYYEKFIFTCSAGLLALLMLDLSSCSGALPSRQVEVNRFKNAPVSRLSPISLQFYLLPAETNTTHYKLAVEYFYPRGNFHIQKGDLLKLSISSNDSIILNCIEEKSRLEPKTKIITSSPQKSYLYSRSPQLFSNSAFKEGVKGRAIFSIEKKDLSKIVHTSSMLFTLKNSLEEELLSGQLLTQSLVSDYNKRIIETI